MHVGKQVVSGVASIVVPGSCCSSSCDVTCITVVYSAAPTTLTNCRHTLLSVRRFLLEHFICCSIVCSCLLCVVCSTLSRCVYLFGLIDCVKV